jgi:heterodisulfide reductase subunit A-like polyferredoxin
VSARDCTFAEREGAGLERSEVLIVGGGLVGQTLASRLSRDGYDVTLVEKDPDRLREVSETLDIQFAPPKPYRG